MPIKKSDDDEVIRTIKKFYREADNGKPKRLISLSAFAAAMFMNSGEDASDILSEIEQYSAKQLKAGSDIISDMKRSATIDGYTEIADKTIAILDDLAARAARREVSA